MAGPCAVAIDGPAGVGKTTVGKLAAERLGFLFLDTGLMYRAVAWAALQRGIEPTDGPALDALAHHLRIEIEPATVDDGRPHTVWVEGEDVTWRLRDRAVEATVSEVSTWPEVRRALVPKQQQIARGKRIVMVGRDIGSYVLPMAQVKIFLHASLEVRARRRSLELAARGMEVSWEQSVRDVRHRDDIDSHRAFAPLQATADASVIDTETIDAGQVVAQVVELVRQRCPT